MRTLLVGTPETQWEPIREARFASAPWVVLDPGRAARSMPTRCVRLEGDRPVASITVGSLSPERVPHALLAAAARLMGTGEVVVEAFAYRPLPILRQTLHLLAEMVQPTTLLLSAETGLDRDQWPVGPEVLELPAALPPMVRDAQRRAQWLKMIERSHRHEFALDRVTWMGSRLGSGRRLECDLPGISWLEIDGPVLFAVGDRELREAEVARLLDDHSASRLVRAQPEDYEDLVCAFVREGGEEFGFGRIESLDFDARRGIAWTDAIPPVPIRTVKLGLQRVDADGNEGSEVKVWSI